MSWTKRILYGLLVVLILIQFIPVERDNPPVSGPISAPPAVIQIFRSSCWDCHSNETEWHWYAYIAPVSWLTAGHVHDGRKRLNFSTWAEYSARRQAKLREEIVEEVQAGEMPLPIYFITHPEAELDARQKQTLQEWAGLAAHEEHR